MLGVHDFLVQARDTRKKSCNFDKKIRLNILLHYAPALILRITGFFAKCFLQEWIQVKAWQTGKNRKTSQKRRVKLVMSRSSPTLDILPSARAKTPKAIICTRNKAILTLESKNAATVKPSRFFAFPFHSPTLFQVKAYFLFQLLHCWNNTGQVIWKVSACGWISSHGRMANICLLTAAGWIGNFSNDEGDGGENVKKSNMLISKTTTLHVQHTFLYIFLPSLHDYGVEISNFAFYGGHEQATTNFSFSFKTWV